MFRYRFSGYLVHLFSFLLFITCSLYPNPIKISGKVSDAATGDALSDATVYITYDNTTDSINTGSSGQWEYNLHHIGGCLRLSMLN